MQQTHSCGQQSGLILNVKQQIPYPFQRSAIRTFGIVSHSQSRSFRFEFTERLPATIAGIRISPIQNRRYFIKNQSVSDSLLFGEEIFIYLLNHPVKKKSVKANKYTAYAMVLYIHSTVISTAHP
jgi:hypothetical protein